MATMLIYAASTFAGSNALALDGLLEHDVVVCDGEDAVSSRALLDCAGNAPRPPRALPALRSIQRLKQGLGGRVLLAPARSQAPAAVVDIDAPRRTGSRKAATSPATSVDGTPGIPCIGDGTKGNRVQVVYAYRGGSGHSAEIIPLIRRWAADVDATFRVSAARQGGRRHVRWVTTPGCVLQVMKVRISKRSAQDFNAMQVQIYRKGLRRADRRYLIWADAATYCGISTTIGDDRRSQRNRNNGKPHGPTSWSRIDRPCWDATLPELSAAAHELTHALGAVQRSAPHKREPGHCTDRYELMCYAKAKRYPCSNEIRQGPWMDCGRNDYFSVKPKKGSYLARKWNVARSSFVSSTAKSDPIVYWIDVDEPMAGQVDGMRTLPLRLSFTADSQPVSALLWISRDGGRFEPILPSGGTIERPLVDVEVGHDYLVAAAVIDDAGRQGFALVAHPDETVYVGPSKG